MKKKRIVVKVGSAVLTENNEVSIKRISALVDFLAQLQEKNELLFVSSGAVSAGYTELQLDRSILSHKQALASIGQPILMKKYSRKFAAKNIIVSQVLVNAANFKRKGDLKRVQDSVNILLSNGVLPIINENDATATEELKVGDNDQLAATVAKHINADLLIILSDIDAYYSDDPHKNPDAKVLKVVHDIPQKELKKKATPHDIFATGGIVTQLKAASALLDSGIDMLLASGFDLEDVKNFTLNATHTGGTLFTKAE